jgi:hypothetical protein
MTSRAKGEHVASGGILPGTDADTRAVSGVDIIEGTGSRQGLSRRELIRLGIKGGTIAAVSLASPSVFACVKGSAFTSISSQSGPQKQVFNNGPGCDYWKDGGNAHCWPTNYCRKTVYDNNCAFHPGDRRGYDDNWIDDDDYTDGCESREHGRQKQRRNCNPRVLKVATKHSQCFPKGHRNKSCLEVLSSPNEFDRLCMAQLLNRQTGKCMVMNENEIRDMHSDIRTSGCYYPTAGVRWDESQCVIYLRTCQT